MEGSALWRWRGLQLLRRSALVMLVWDMLQARKGYWPPPEIWDAGLERLGQHLTRFAHLVGALGAQPLVAVIPDAAQVRGEHPSRELGLRALELARTHGLTAIDLLPALRALDGEARAHLTIAFDGHYDGVGYRAMAAEIARTLVP
jgi:hypothetical protein